MSEEPAPYLTDTFAQSRAALLAWLATELPGVPLTDEMNPHGDVVITVGLPDRPRRILATYPRLMAKFAGRPLEALDVYLLHHRVAEVIRTLAPGQQLVLEHGGVRVTRVPENGPGGIGFGGPA